VEVSALKHAGVAGVHGRSPLLRLQSDERLVGLIRRGNHHAFEALMGRYQSRLLAFCRHMLGCREDAEDVLQEVFAAAFNAIQADERPLNVRPWLYRIARNRSLNHLRRTQAIGVDSMDIHFSENGQTTADRVHKREEFRLLLADVQQLPETQRSALLLREIDALSYDQIAEAMDTTVPSVKSLLVRARVSLAEAAEARQLSCDEVRLELGEMAEGLKKLTPPVRRHLRTCERCSAFRKQLRETNKALAAIFPVGPVLLLKKLLLAHLGFGSSATAGGGATAGAGAGAGAAASTAAGTAAAGGAAGSILSAGAGAVATKAAAGLAAAAIVSVGAVEVRQATVESPDRTAALPTYTRATGGITAPATPAKPASVRHPAKKVVAEKAQATTTTVADAQAATTPAPPHPPSPPAATRTETVTDTTVLPTTTTTTSTSPPPPSPTPSSTTTSPSSDGTSSTGGTSGPPSKSDGGSASSTTTETTPPPPPPQPTQSGAG
jgi:RNA polymerase sigma factor (sigma-70 family)